MLLPRSNQKRLERFIRELKMFNDNNQASCNKLILGANKACRQYNSKRQELVIPFSVSIFHRAEVVLELLLHFELVQAKVLSLR